MENRGIVKVSQVRHVLAFFVLGGVDLSDEVFLEVLGLFFVSEDDISRSRDIFWYFLFREIDVADIFRHARENIGREIFFFCDGRQSQVGGCAREKEKF